MSTTYSIAYNECRQHIWIAQSTADEGYVYTTPEAAKALYSFLTAHRGHALSYDENCQTKIADYSEIEVQEKTTDKRSSIVEATEHSIVMAYEAMRLALGQPTLRNKPEDVILWLSIMATGPTEPDASDAGVKEHFHKCWGEAHDSPGYNKRNWMKLQTQLQQRGIKV